MPHVLHILEATEGGTRRHVRDLTLGLAAQGWQVALAVAMERDPRFADDLPLLRAHGIDLHVVPMSRRPAPVRDPQALRRLVRLIRRLQPDLIHTHSTKAGALGRLAARLCGVTAVHTPHAFPFEMRVARPIRVVYRAWERLARTWTARLIAVCNQEAALARHLGYPAAQVVRIWNGIDIVPSPDATAVTAEQATGPQLIGADRNPADRVAFIGRCCRQKAPDVLITAATHVLRARPGTRFTLMGSGALDPRVSTCLRTAGVQDAFEHLPSGDAHAVTGLLERSHILALPSRWEGLPYTLLEAMAAGVPTVATAVGGIPDVITDGVDGLLVPPEDPKALARALLRLLGDDGLHRRLACAARQRVRSFTCTAMVDATAEVYREVLHHRRPQ